MMVLKYMGETYNACSPRHIGNHKYTCDAWKERTQRVVKKSEILNALGQMLMRGGKW